VLLKTHRLDGWYDLETLARRYSEWRIQDGILELHRGGKWLSTGDLVEQRNELLRVIGRADAVANVAGTKVALDEVTRLAEEVPGIRRAVAEAESNAISGEIVVLRYALEHGVGPAAVKTAAEEFLRQRLPKPAWPRRWIVDEVGLGEAGKRAGMREAGSRE
jgi:acyl-CoA synthetase (AMP-forming)/AMP-acid ligase II